MTRKMSFALALVLTLMVGCSTSAPTPPETSAPVSEAAASPPVAESKATAATEAVASESATGETAPAAPAERNYLEPPDGVWLVDEEGQEYFLLEVPRIEGHYLFLNEKQVRLRGGMTLNLERYDDANFYAKIIRVRPEDNPPVRRPKPTPAELEAAAARYRVELPETDRLVPSPFDAGLPRAGQWRNGFVVIDMNRDGFVDIVHGPARKGDGRPKVFLGDGKGTWKEWPLRVQSPRLDYGDVAVADFDGDGHLDMALGMHLLGIQVLLGDGKGGFRAGAQGLDYRVPQGGPDGGRGFASRALEIVDWDQDGRPDILAIGEGMRLNVGLEGPRVGGSGSFGPVVYLNRGRMPDGAVKFERFDQGTAHGAASDVIAAGDFDGDGRVDFVVGNSGLNIVDTLFLARPDGGWEGSRLPLRTKAFAHGFAVADFDNDGRLDIAVAWTNFEFDVRRSGIDILWNRTPAPPAKRRGRDSTTTPPAALVLEPQLVMAIDGTRGFESLAAADLDGDRKMDLVGADGEGTVIAFLGDGRGGFSRQEISRQGSGDACRGYALAAVDLDGDGRVELVGGFAGEQPNPLEMTLSPDNPFCRSHGSLRAWKLGTK